MSKPNDVSRLLDAAGKERALRQLLPDGVDINTHCNFGETALHKAASKDYESCIVNLIAAGADINAKDRYGFTPVHFASSGFQVKGCHASLRHLIEAGADLECKDLKFSMTPLFMAIEGVNLSGIKALLAAGANVRAVNGVGDTVLHASVIIGSPEMVSLFLAHGVPADVRADDGNNALWRVRSVNEEYGECVARLIEAGADPKGVRIGEENMDLYAYAQGSGWKRVVSLLERHALLDSVKKTGSGPGVPFGL